MPVPDGADRCAHGAHLEEARSAEEHERTYGHRAGAEEPVELVSIQLVGSGLREGSGVPQRGVGPTATASRAAAQAYFGEHGWLETPVLGRADLAAGRAGPLIVEEYDATCVVPPGAPSASASATS